MTPEEFKDHILFEKFEQLNQRIQDSEIIENIDLESLTYIKTATLYISDRIKKTIPELVQDAEMNALSNEIDAGLAQINSFIGNQNPGHITNAKNNLVAAISRIRNFPLPFTKGDFNFSSSIAGFQDSISSKYFALNELGSNVEKALIDIQQSISQKADELEKLNQLIKDKEAQIQVLNSKFQNDYDSFKSTSTQQISSDRESYRKEIDNDKKAYQSEIEEIKNVINSDTSELIEDLENKFEEAKRLVNLIGNVGGTGNYKKIASEHKTSANFWRIVAILFMSALSGLLVWTIIDLSAKEFEWTISIIRLIGAAVLSYPATYAARESSKHRRLETINRTAELELASINPFIENLDEEKKKLIIEKLVDKYFGNKTDVTDKSDEELSISGFERLVKVISSLVSK